MASALVLAMTCSAGCAARKATLLPSDFGRRPDGALQIELTLDDAADLDLHVTDPTLETVYFGNSPSRSGGRLDRDVRCQGEAPGDARREAIRFDPPRAGAYRVGIDYVKACRRFRKQAGYRIRVIGPGIELEQAGRIGPGRFDHKALEFEWPTPAIDSRAKTGQATPPAD